MKEFIIQKNEENQRFDKYLKKLLPNASTSFLYKMMRKKNIVINKKKVEGNEKLKVGDVVSIFLSDDDHKIIVVGDPKQSIYSFQGADINVYYHAVNTIFKVSSIKVIETK